MQTLGITRQLIFINRNIAYNTTISFYKFDESLPLNLYDFLSIKEINRANSYTQEKRKNSYLLGRISAKIAIMKHLNLYETKNFHIDNGVLFQPAIIGLNSPYLHISLSHTQDIGAAIVSEDRHPIGIDIEFIDNSSSNDVMSLLSQNEKKLLNEVDPLILWTAKESLSKCLKIGLTVPYEWFEVDKIIHLTEYCFDIYFLNLNQFKATVFIAFKYVVACSYHIHSVVSLKEWFDIQSSLLKYQVS